MIFVTVIKYVLTSLFSCGIDDLYNCKYDYRSSACQPQYIKVIGNNWGISQLKKTNRQYDQEIRRLTLKEEQLLQQNLIHSLK
jgi:hypothetical protein